MILLGVGFASWMVTIPVLLQTNTSDEMRGRVISLYYMTILTYQLGWFFGGMLLESFGIHVSVLIATIGSLSIGATTILFSKSYAIVNPQAHGQNNSIYPIGFFSLVNSRKMLI